MSVAGGDATAERTEGGGAGGNCTDAGGAAGATQEDVDSALSSLETTLISDPEIEADLCLALEMVRHRPLRITGTERDERGLCAHEGERVYVHVLAGCGVQAGP